LKKTCTKPAFGPVISPTLTSLLHFTFVPPTVSRSVAPLFELNGFGNGPDHSGNAEADDAAAALIASAKMRQSATVLRRVIAHAPFPLWVGLANPEGQKLAPKASLRVKRL
jgi:hypothetical protein